VRERHSEREGTLTTRQDSLEEGEVQSFRVTNDTVLILVAADIVDMYMSIIYN